MGGIFQPLAAGIKYTFNFIVTGRRLAVKLGGIFNKQTKPQKTIHEKVVISRKPLKLYTMYTEKDLQKKIAELEKEVNNLANWLRNDENIENTDNLLFYMLLALNSLQHAQMLSVLSLNKYLEQNPDAAKY